MKKLENDILEGVNIGDILRLKATEDAVCRFLEKMVLRKAELTQQCLFNEERDYTTFFLNVGGAAYKLPKFSEYIVIPKNLFSKESSENQKA